MRGARNTNHPCTFKIDQRNLVETGNTFNQQLGIGLGTDQGAGLLGCERIADPDRDLLCNGRRHSLRMNNLGTEVRQLHRLVI